MNIQSETVVDTSENSLVKSTGKDYRCKLHLFKYFTLLYHTFDYKYEILLYIKIDF